MSKNLCQKPPKNALLMRGTRKLSVASATFWENEDKNGFIKVNDVSLDSYFFGSRKLISKIDKVFNTVGDDQKKYSIVIKVHGGGSSGQACAVAYVIAKCLAVISTTNKAILKGEGMLTRDARALQSKSTGHPKARKTEQFSKR